MRLGFFMSKFVNDSERLYDLLCQLHVTCETKQDAWTAPPNQLFPATYQHLSP